MATSFDAAVIAAILHHMNDDHTDDNLLITRAFAASGDEITAAVMTGLDGEAGLWRVTRGDKDEEVRIAWPGGPITERAEVRREVVALYDAACSRLGVTPRPHN